MSRSQLSSRDLCLRAREVIEDSRTELLSFQFRRYLLRRQREAWQRDKPQWQVPQPARMDRHPAYSRDQRFMRDVMEYEARAA